MVIISQLLTLEYLNVSNLYSSASPWLDRKETLPLRTNEIKCISELKNLRVLDISSRTLELLPTHYETITKLTKLEMLKMGAPLYQTLPIDPKMLMSISELKNLKVLSLCRALFTDEVDFKVFLKMKNLEELYIHECANILDNLPNEEAMRKVLVYDMDNLKRLEFYKRCNSKYYSLSDIFGSYSSDEDV